MAETNPSPAASSTARFTPMQIARHRLFTAKEKIDLLNKIRAEIRGAYFSERELGFPPSEVDDAIAAVRLGAQRGEQVRTVVWGDN
ncbi:MAG: hypothetical protein ACOVO5_09775 [Devosia sp.]